MSNRFAAPRIGTSFRIPMSEFHGTDLSNPMQNTPGPVKHEGFYPGQGVEKPFDRLGPQGAGAEESVSHGLS
jgi:hypothetical protein